MKEIKLTNKIDDYSVLFYNAGSNINPNYRILLNEKRAYYTELRAKMIRYNAVIKELESIFNIFDKKDLNQNSTIYFCDRDCKVEELINIYKEIELKLLK